MNNEQIDALEPLAPDLAAELRAERAQANALRVEIERQAALIDELAEAAAALLRESADGVFAPGYRAVRQAQAALSKTRGEPHGG